MKIKKSKILIVLSIAIIFFTNPNSSYYYAYSDNSKTTTNIQEKESVNKSYNSRKVAYITIDDGPSKYTEDILRILDKYKVKGTFFLINRNMNIYPEKVKKIVESGNTAGLHSVSHDINKLYKTSISAKEEFDLNNQTFYEITGRYSNLVRLPYGSKPYASKESYNNLVSAGYKIWDWNIDTQDWKSSSSEIVENTKIYSKNKNEIILLIHEKKQTVEALDSLISYLIEEGYDILPINENQDPKNFWLKNLYK